MTFRRSIHVHYENSVMSNNPALEAFMWFCCCFGEAFFFQQRVTLLSVSQLTHAGRNVKPLPGNKPSFSTLTVRPSGAFLLKEAVRFTFGTLKVGQLYAHTLTHTHSCIYRPVKPTTLTEFDCRPPFSRTHCLISRTVREAVASFL